MQTKREAFWELLWKKRLTGKKLSNPNDHLSWPVLISIVGVRSTLMVLVVLGAAGSLVAIMAFFSWLVVTIINYPAILIPILSGIIIGMLLTAWLHIDKVWKEQHPGPEQKSAYRPVGLGLFPLPGEKKRMERAEKEARTLVEGLREIEEDEYHETVE